MFTVPRKRKPTLMPAIALASLAAVGAIPIFASTSLEAAAPRHFTTIHVRAGDSLWRIAATHAAADADVQDVLDRIVALNRLQGSDLVPGRTLQIPAP